MELTVILAWLTLGVGVPLNVTTTYLLRRKSRQAPHLRVLKERFIVAAITTIVVLVFGVIFVNNDRGVPWLGLDATKLITRVAMLGIAIIPAVGWLLIYRQRGKQ
jgi:hypothetical protein